MLKRYFHCIVLAAFAAGTCMLSIQFANGQNAPAITPIYEVQGAGASTPFAGREVTIEGVVTGDFAGREKLNGFFVQEVQGDGDPKTADGIFIYLPEKNPLSRTGITQGDRVRVAGKAEEFKGATQIGFVTELKVVEKASTPPAPVEVRLPLAKDVSLESLEGMLITIPQTLTVSGNYNLERYGELELSSGGRLFAPTNGNGQSREENLLRLLLLDDGSTQRQPQPTPHLGTDETRRLGDTTAGISGVLTYAFNAYRIQPLEPPVFTRVNARPEPLAVPGSGLKIAAFNVHNYFTTLKSEKKSARGASTPQEFAAQSAKVVAALKALDADIVGLSEVENNGEVAVSDLIAKLNAAYGANTYEAVPDPATGVGSDLIKCAVIYKPASVSRVGNSQSDPQKIYSRVPVAQTFKAHAGGEVLTVVVSHFKSKGSCPKTGDVDAGQGCWNGKRVEQSQALLGFVQTLQDKSGDDDVLALGDFNAYLKEDPITTLESGGLANLNKLLPVSRQYSSQYKAHSGLLDYAFATPSLRAQVAGVSIWHINADEPAGTNEQNPTPYGSSDHDPVLVALRRQSAHPLAQR